MHADGEQRQIEGAHNASDVLKQAAAANSVAAQKVEQKDVEKKLKLPNGSPNPIPVSNKVGGLNRPARNPLFPGHNPNNRGMPVQAKAAHAPLLGPNAKGVSPLREPGSTTKDKPKVPQIAPYSSENTNKMMQELTSSVSG